MVRIFLFLVLIGAGCNNEEQQQTSTLNSDSEKVQEKPTTSKEPEKTDTQLQNHIYSNKRFKEVTIEKLQEHEFRIKGKGQIFEASFSWVVEDGHEELAKGFQMTTAGAPEWGEFMFTINVKKKRPNSTLTLILFEASAKEGRRQHELPITLYQIYSVR
jgi:hypothetical protein